MVGDIFSPYDDGNPKRISLNDVEKYDFSSYGLNADMVKKYMFGIRVIDPETQEELEDDFYDLSIAKAVSYLEKVLDVQILPNIINETKDFFPSDYSSSMFLKLKKRPVLQVEQLSTSYNGQPLMDYPSQLWKVSSIGGTIQIVPTIGMGIMNSVTGQSDAMSLYGGTMLDNMGIANFGIPYMGATTGQSIPQLFRVGYVAGMLPQRRLGVEEDWEMPTDLKVLVLKVAANDVFEQFGRLIIGAGVASKSFTMDGISEEINTTQSAEYGGASADIKQLESDIAKGISALKARYGIRVGVI